MPSKPTSPQPSSEKPVYGIPLMSQWREPFFPPVATAVSIIDLEAILASSDPFGTQLANFSRRFQQNTLQIPLSAEDLCGNSCFVADLMLLIHLSRHSRTLRLERMANLDERFFKEMLSVLIEHYPSAQILTFTKTLAVLHNITMPVWSSIKTQTIMLNACTELPLNTFILKAFNLPVNAPFFGRSYSHELYDSISTLVRTHAKHQSRMESMIQTREFLQQWAEYQLSM